MSKNSSVATEKSRRDVLQLARVNCNQEVKELKLWQN